MPILRGSFSIPETCPETSDLISAGHLHRCREIPALNPSHIVLQLL